MTRRKLLSLIDQARIEEAIRRAELGTSAEIRVSVAGPFWGNERRMAERAFARLGMNQTSERNGVLIFIAPLQRHFDIVADDGASARVAKDFWAQVCVGIEQAFREERFQEGMVNAIRTIGGELQRHFPATRGKNPNELSNELDGPSHGPLSNPQGR